MRFLNVAFIDDGINEEGISLDGKYTFYHYVLDKKKIAESRESIKNKESHGTLCAKMFTGFAPICNIHDIKIPTTRKDNMKSEDINIALKWCINNDIQIISMSLGILSMLNISHLKHSIRELTKQGTIIVATSSNTNKVTYPASFPDVIGIRYDRDGLLNDGEYYYLQNPIDGINVITSLPKKHPLNYYEELYENKNFMTNSFAAPYIASKICSYLNEGMSMKVIRKALENNSKRFPSNQIYKYYESCIVNYKEERLIDIPIVAVLANEKAEGAIYEELYKIFKANGYLCGLINDDDDITEIKFSKKWASEYSISINQLITLIINNTIMDILLITIAEEELDELLSSKLVDIILKPKSLSIISELDTINYSMNYNIKKIFKKIVNIFNN
ncbi:S8 family serine peptidase [Clostridiaceae bacterium M8S5]|nr:S8 family serine peptidase [Clostridiaceae bacterium M8S5]